MSKLDRAVVIRENQDGTRQYAPICSKKWHELKFMTVLSGEKMAKYFDESSNLTYLVDMDGYTRSKGYDNIFDTTRFHKFYGTEASKQYPVEVEILEKDMSKNPEYLIRVNSLGEALIYGDKPKFATFFDGIAEVTNEDNSLVLINEKGQNVAGKEYYDSISYNATVKKWICTKRKKSWYYNDAIFDVFDANGKCHIQARLAKHFKENPYWFIVDCNRKWCLYDEEFNPELIIDANGNTVLDRKLENFNIINHPSSPVVIIDNKNLLFIRSGLLICGEKFFASNHIDDVIHDVLGD